MIGWLADLLRRRRLEQDLAEEIRQHLDEKTDALVASGMSREDAAKAARRAFGNVTRLEEQGREVWRFPAIEDVAADVRFALRQLRKSPAFALAGTLTLALGIGANTTVFSVVNAVILRPLPYPESDRLVSVRSLDIRGTPHPATLSYPTFFDFRAENSVFEHIVSYRDAEFTLAGTEQPIHLRGQIVSSDPFQMLHVRPAVGRGFLPNEEAAGERVVILSHELWRGRFGGDPAVVGAALTIDGQPHTVVGVAPPRFEFPIAYEPVQIWTTVARDAASAMPVTEQRGARMLNAMARLKPDVSIEQAQAQMDTIAASLAVRYPDSNRNLPGTYVRPAIDQLAGDARLPLLILLAAVGLVLVGACANMANLLLAHTEERAREFTVRAAIGAGRARIVRQSITESLTLAVIGCAAGLAVAAWSIRLFRALPIPRVGEAVIDGRVLTFSLVLAVVTSVLFGLAPALRAASTEFSGGVKDGSRTSTPGSDRLRHSLCVAQVALGLILVSGAGLLTGSFLHLVRRDLGFRPDGLLTFSVDLPGRHYAGSKQLEFHSRLLDELRSLPGVTSSALAMPLPLTGDQMNIAFNIQQRPAPPAERPRANMAIVTPGFFRTFGVPILEGRDFVERDDATAAQVLIVNRAFADRFFPGENALGKRIEPGATSDASGTKMREIVGIVGNARQSALKMEDEPIYYFPYRQLPWCCPSVVVRSAIAAASLEPALRRSVASLDKQLPIYDLRTAVDMLVRGVAAPRFLMLLLGSFAGIALLLTAIGLYGVLASSVVTRTREMGVRLALGATRQQVLAIVLRRAMLLLLVGLAIGAVGAFAGNRLLSTMLFFVAPHNPLIVGAACMVLTITAAAAAYLPARRAASIDPIRALRAE